jgi:molecular chaperone DnaK
MVIEASLLVALSVAFTFKKMQEDAEKHKEEDEKKKDLVDKRNTAETSIFAAEKSLKDYADKLDDATKTAINEKITALKDVKDKDDAAAIDSATSALSDEMMKIYEIIQKAEQEKNTAPTSEPAAEEAKEEGTEEGK